MTITIIGTGFVGVVSAAVYASQGNQVIGLDIDPDKINKLKNGQVPFYEPDLKELLIEQQKNHRLTFTTSYQEAISQSEIIIIAVGTPSAPDETADLRYVMKSGDSLAPYLTENAIVAILRAILAGLMAVAWSIISFFVLPLIMQLGEIMAKGRMQPSSVSMG